MEFGGETGTKQLLTLAQNIKTFTESTDPKDRSISAIREKMLNSSEIVIFLGFAFHRSNLDLLSGRGDQALPARDARFYGTAKGISKSDCDIITTDLGRLFGAHRGYTELRNDLTRSELFREYWRSFSLQ